MKVRTTVDGVEYVRTPRRCFTDLPDWTFKQKFVEIDGLRQGYIEEGPMDGEVILMLHGQPAWSYLYRVMIRELAARGYRVIAMDHLGFGTSDKPIDLNYYTFDDHADRLERFMDALDLHDFNFFVQDWGSVIGLYVAAGDLDRYRRIIVGNGGLPVVTQRSEPPEDLEASNAAFHQTLLSIPDLQPPFFDADGNPILVGGDPGEGPEPFGQWVAYAKTSEDFQPSIMCEALTYYPLTEAEEYAYDAPYPHRISMAGARMFPSLRDELVGLTQERKDTLRTYDRPFLTIFGANDPGLSGEGDDQQWMIENIAGAEGQPHERIPDGSHFFQDDKGFEVAAMVDDFIRRTP